MMKFKALTMFEGHDALYDPGRGPREGIGYIGFIAGFRLVFVAHTTLT